MMDAACGGLWRDGTVYKSPILNHARFWVSPDMPTALREVIVGEAMPTLSDWTGRTWVEVAERPSEPFTALLWRHAEPYRAGADNPDCAQGEQKWLGCAHHRDGSIEIRDLTNYGARPPAVYLRETALHEALHILYQATHTVTGIMCIDRDAPECGIRKVSSGGYRWALREADRDADVYSLFAHLAIENGMSPQQVARLFGAAPPPSPTPTPSPTPVPITPTPAPSVSAAELAAIAAGTRCSGLASLKVLDWIDYPRLDAEGRISMSGEVGPDAPRLKDARRTVRASRHPLFTFYAQEINDSTGNFRSVGRLWPLDMKDRLSGSGSPNVFAEVYNVTDRSFHVVATLPPALLAYDDLRVSVWTELVEEPGTTGRTAAAGSCKVWR